MAFMLAQQASQQERAERHWILLSDTPETHTFCAFPDQRDPIHSDPAIGRRASDRPIIIGDPGLFPCVFISGLWLAASPRATGMAETLATQLGGWLGPLVGIGIVVGVLTWGVCAFVLNARFAYLQITAIRRQEG